MFLLTEALSNFPYRNPLPFFSWFQVHKDLKTALLSTGWGLSLRFQEVKPRQSLDPVAAVALLLWVVVGLFSVALGWDSQLFVSIKWG